MSTSGSAVSTEMREQIDSEFQAFRSLSNSPSGLGWAIHEFVMANAATRGELRGGAFELPMMVTISLPQSAPPATSPPAQVGTTPAASGSTDKVSETTACHSVCYSILGHQIYCATTCTHEVISHTHTTG